MAEGQADRRVMWTLAVQIDPAARETIEQYIAMLERIPGTTTRVGARTPGEPDGGGATTDPVRPATLDTPHAQPADTRPMQIAAQGVGGPWSGARPASSSTPESTLHANPRVNVRDTSSPVIGFDVSRSPAMIRFAHEANEQAYRAGEIPRERYESQREFILQQDPAYQQAQADAERERMQFGLAGKYRPAWMSDQRRMEAGNRRELSEAQRFPGRYDPRSPDEREIARTVQLEDSGVIDTTESARRLAAIREAAQRKQEALESKGIAKAQGADATKDYRQAESYEDRRVRERDVATRRAMGQAERQSRFGETPQARRDREIAESRHQYDLGNITPQQHLAAKGGIQRQYDTRQAQERNRLENEYFRTQQRIESAHASIHRQMSYAGMAAMELGRGFGYIGAMAGKSTEQVLKLLATVEAVFAIGRGITLGMSAIENIAKQRALIAHASMTAAGGAAGAVGGAIRAQGLAGRTVGGIPQWEGAPIGLNPEAVGAGWVGGAAAGATPGMGGMFGGMSMGMLGAGAVAGGAMMAPFALGSWMHRILSPNLGQDMSVSGRAPAFSGLPGIRMAETWERRARAWEASRRQSEETSPIYAARQAEYERETAIAIRRSGLGAREAGIGGLPSMFVPERPYEEAKLEHTEQRARLTAAQEQLANAQAAQAKVEKQASDAAENNRIRAERLKELESRRTAPAFSGAPGGMGGFQRQLTIPEELEREQLRRGVGFTTGPSQQSVEEARKRTADAANKNTEEQIRDTEVLRKLREARIAYLRVLEGSAKEQFDALQGRAGSATRSIMERRRGVGAMNEGEFAQLHIAVGLVRAGADPRVMPEQYKQMIRSGMGGYDLQHRLARQEVDLGAARIGMIGGDIEAGDMRRKQLADRARLQAAGQFVPEGADKPEAPSPGGLGGIRIQLAQADSEALKDSVIQEKAMVGLLTKIHEFMRAIEAFENGRRAQEEAAKKAAGANAGEKGAFLPAGGIGANQKMLVA